ncbi:MAG: hypothetical protein ABIK68_13520 [bacterium]
MAKFSIKLIPFRVVKLFLKFLAALASAIVVVSGYLFFISNNERSRVNEPVIKNTGMDDEDKQPQEKN